MESGSNSIFAMSGPMRLALFMAITGICMIAGAFISFSIVAVILKVQFSDMQTILLLPEHAQMAQLANALASVIAFGLPWQTKSNNRSQSISQLSHLSMLR